MKTLLQKINSLSITAVLLLILVFFLPFQHGSGKLFKKWVYLHLDYNFHFYLSDVLILTLAGLCFFSMKLHHFFLKNSNKYLTGFLIFSFLSILYSPDRNLLWVYHSWLAIAIPSCLFFVLSNHHNVKEIVQKGLWVLLFASLVESGIAFTQYMQQAPLGLNSLGEPAFFSAFASTTKTKWILDPLFHSSLPSFILQRATGTFPHANVLGTFMGISIFATFYLYLSVNKSWKKNLLFLALFIQEFIVFISYSRAALYGIALGSIFWFGYSLWKKLPVKGFLTGFLLSTACCLILLYPQLRDRGGVFNYNQIAKGSDEIRLNYQQAALDYSKNDRLLGVGWHHCFINMARISTEYKDAKMIDAHNIYLMIFTAAGLFAFVCFMGFIVSILVHSLKQVFDPLSFVLFTIFVFLLWVGCCDYLLIKSVNGRLFFFLIAGLLSQMKENSDKSNEIKTCHHC